MLFRKSDTAVVRAGDSLPTRSSPKAVEYFINRLTCEFKEQFDNEDQAVLASAMRQRRLSQFDDETLDKAADYLERTHRSDWMPRTAVILDVCRAMQCGGKLVQGPLTSDRHFIADDGRQKFQPDAKLATIEYCPIFGTHGNEVIDAVSGAVAAHVERAITGGLFVLCEGLRSVLREIERCVRRYVAEERYGTPTDIAGGPCAVIGDGCVRGSSRNYRVHISQPAFDKMLERYPYVNAERNRYAKALAYEFGRAASFATKAYGEGLQEEVVARYELYLAELNESVRTRPEREAAERAEIAAWKAEEARKKAEAKDEIRRWEEQRLQLLAESQSEAARALWANGTRVAVETTERGSVR